MKNEIHYNTQPKYGMDETKQDIRVEKQMQFPLLNRESQATIFQLLACRVEWHD